MACSLYFDLSEMGSFPWALPLTGICLSLFGAAVYVAAGQLRISVLRRLLKSGALVFSVGWIGLSLFLAFQAYFDRRNLASAIAHGDLRHVEGPIRDLVPAPRLGNRIERFTVDGKQFAYSANDLSSGFRKAGAEDNPIREGLTARVSYVGEKVVRMEICK
jgi:hypothetical protein